MSRDSSYFKKIQLSLFDLLNSNPSEKFKGKDLLGPLKYLKEETQEAPQETAQDKIKVGTPEPGSIPLHDRERKPSASPKTVDSMDIQDLDRLTGGLQILGLPLIVHRKPYQRHLRFYVKPNSTLHVVAPMSRPIEIIKKELFEHREWIEKCNEKFEKLRHRFPVKKFMSGQPLPFMGEVFNLRMEAADFKKPFIQMDLDQLQYFYPISWDLLPKTEKQSLLKKHLLKFYHEKATFHLNQRVRLLSEKTQLFPKRLTFRNQKTRWGSCSSDGNVNLNWKLMAFDQELIDYVIIHELCHLKHPNHSKRFWALVQSHCPEYKSLNKQLNHIQFEADFLAPKSELYFSNPMLP